VPDRQKDTRSGNSIRESPLRGKIALVTGAARRLGRATALALAGEGADLVLHCNRSLDQLEDTVAEAREMGVRVSSCQADFSKKDAVDEMFAEAIEKAGQIDFLVNNASIFPQNDLSTLSENSLQECMRINVYAPAALSRKLAEQGIPGSIVNYLDTRIVRRDPDHIDYLISKRALQSMTIVMAREFAPQVRVNAVAPGLILPPRGEDSSYLEGLAERIPLQRHGGTRDVANAALFLLKTDFITGQVIFVDGGEHLKGSKHG